MLSEKFLINYRSFTSVVLRTQTLHQQWLHTRTCYKKYHSATIMVIKFELKNVDQIGTSVSFWPKKVKYWNFEGDCVLNSSTGKVATWGVLIYSWNMAFSDKMQNFFKESSWSAFYCCWCSLAVSSTLFTIEMFLSRELWDKAELL